MHASSPAVVPAVHCLHGLDAQSFACHFEDDRVGLLGTHLLQSEATDAIAFISLGGLKTCRLIDATCRL